MAVVDHVPLLMDEMGQQEEFVRRIAVAVVAVAVLWLFRHLDVQAVLEAKRDEYPGSEAEGPLCWTDDAVQLLGHLQLVQLVAVVVHCA